MADCDQTDVRAKEKLRDLEREAMRNARLHAASAEDGVYEPGHKSHGAVDRALRRLRSALAHRK